MTPMPSPAQRPRRTSLLLPLLVALALASAGGLLDVLDVRPAAAAEQETRAEKKAARAAEKKAYDALAGKYREWLDQVDAIISPDERSAFLALDKDYQRDAFIERFWEVRDPYQGTGRNEFRERWEARVEEARLRLRQLQERPRAHPPAQRPAGR